MPEPHVIPEVVEPVVVPEPEPEPVVVPEPQPVVEVFVPPQPVEERVVVPVSEPEPVVEEPTPQNNFVEEEAPRETIYVTKTVEVIETVTTEQPAAEVEESDNKTMMILIPAVILSLLLVIAIVMFTRFMCGRKAQKDKLTQAIDLVKTEAVKVEPQFVLDGDDNKNIFSQMGKGPDADFEKDEKARPERIQKKKKRRQKRLDDLGSAYSVGGTSRRSALDSRQVTEQVDDGFNNHDAISHMSYANSMAEQSMSEKKLVDNSAMGLSPERRSGGKPGTPEETLHKLKTIALRQVSE